MYLRWLILLLVISAIVNVILLTAPSADRGELRSPSRHSDSSPAEPKASGEAREAARLAPSTFHTPSSQSVRTQQQWYEQLVALSLRQGGSRKQAMLRVADQLARESSHRDWIVHALATEGRPELLAVLGELCELGALGEAGTKSPATTRAALLRLVSPEQSRPRRRAAWLALFAVGLPSRGAPDTSQEDAIVSLLEQETDAAVIALVLERLRWAQRLDASHYLWLRGLVESTADSDLQSQAARGLAGAGYSVSDLIRAAQGADRADSRLAWLDGVREALAYAIGAAAVPDLEAVAVSLLMLESRTDERRELLRVLLPVLGDGASARVLASYGPDEPDQELRTQIEALATAAAAGRLLGTERFLELLYAAPQTPANPR
ncbi:MAG: hypothetical protein AAF581_08495 [Planctomycetota bacterium]